jgi:hypothetical protein
MPIVAASNGIRPEIRALAVIMLNKPVTPQKINDHVGTGDYAAKYISFLNTRYGFTITTQKDGRRVLSYTCVAEPNNIAELRSLKPKETVNKASAVKKTKTSKLVKSKAVKTKSAKNVAKSAKTAEQIKAANLAKMKKVSAKLAAKKKKTKKIIDYVERELGSTGEIATSFNIDPAWDSMDVVDVKSLVTAI